CQTANCFNKSKGVFITDPKLKALLNPQPSWGFSGHKKDRIRFLIFGLGKWLLGESRALKVGINVGLFSRTS
ncbi:hypothetical protein PSU29_05975, partial [Yersinia pestis]|nr:hypothetical protein [Yersinia pestis]MDL0714493.1 hypothetical protein [Yersinia pestis]MDL0726359.1 hypothetical protein [Yersinia pestis]MDL0730267.1 hypothetical protein [Yersinia pestis]MDL0758032.1 hypothetical protein [Yersinia pestis]